MPRFLRTASERSGHKAPPTPRIAYLSVGGSSLPNSTERSDITHTNDIRSVIELRMIGWKCTYGVWFPFQCSFA